MTTPASNTAPASSRSFDVVVSGGGHAGIEAAAAAARLGLRTALVTLELDAIGRMSCNPAIGGLAKGQLVREVDALGGWMGRLTDRAGIQFRMLNTSKGPAVWGPRAQADMDLYSKIARQEMQALPGLELVEGELASFGRAQGELGAATHGSPTNPGPWRLELADGSTLTASALVITAGTFLDALMHTGTQQTVGGRLGEKACVSLSRCLADHGIELYRLKTGTPMRLAADSLDYDALPIQHGDPEPLPFSTWTTGPLVNTATCWITRTGEETHRILRSGFDRSPLFTGVIKGLGPRYCPSIEDKVARFPERTSHQLFVEPEGMVGRMESGTGSSGAPGSGGRIYLNGFSSSLPGEVQEAAMRTLPGFAQARILRMGYAVEYNAVRATQLQPTLECKAHPGLYFAGQVNGTSGYEEAAAQGLVAGANAALKLLGRPPLLSSRAESYLGVMVDDLTTLSLDEPYRMFTSRAEYRLFLRQDNAEARLLAKGHALGLVGEEQWERFQASRSRLVQARKHLTETALSPAVANPWLESIGSATLEIPVRARELMHRPEATAGPLLRLSEAPVQLTRQEEVELLADDLYASFYERQEAEIKRLERLQALPIPADFDYAAAKVLSIEARQVLARERPLTLGQAARLPGVRPPDISAFLLLLERAKVTIPETSR
jgi:tRNA uridine 5-carboxymethylaminomethyl modification enzyme